MLLFNSHQLTRILSCACTYRVNFCMRLVLVMSFIFAFDQNIEKTRSYKCSPDKRLLRAYDTCEACSTVSSLLWLLLFSINTSTSLDFESRRVPV